MGTQRVRTVVGDTIYVYGTELCPQQQELPYDPSASGTRRGASERHFVMYGDTVRLKGTLVNPGKDIRIYARRVVFESGAVLDTSGPDPVLDHKPGDKAQQANQNAGTDGAEGAKGVDGAAAGNIVIVADSLEGKGSVKGGKPVTIGASFGDACAAALSTFTDPKGGLKDITVTHDIRWSGKILVGDKWEIAGTVKLVPPSRIWVRVEMPLLSKPGQGAARVRVFLQDVRLTGKMDIAGQDSGWLKDRFNHRAVPMPSDPFSVELEFEFELKKGSAKLSKSGQDIRVVDRVVDLIVPDLTDPSLKARFAASIPAAFQRFGGEVTYKVVQQIAARVGDALTNPITAWVKDFQCDVSLMAEGGRGGRGQDGHEGMTGAKGSSGVEDGNEQTANGGPGGKGGKGGSAGRSGSGGQGGQVRVEYARSSGLAFLVGIGGGTGGGAARWAEAGPGGEGGDPGTLRDRYKKKFPGRKGAVGPNGDPPSFEGTPGDAGAAGRVGLDARAPEALASQMDVHQLQIVLRSASLAYMNAHTDADYAKLGEVLGWLRQMTQPAPSGRSAPAASDDRAQRDAIRKTVTTLMSHLYSGLDYYGHTPDWTPILTLKQLQGTVKELLDIADVVENQHRIFLQEKSDAEERRAAITQVREKLRSASATLTTQRDALSMQIKQSEGSINQMDAALSKQNQLILWNKMLFDKQFQEYVDKQTQCKFDDVIAVISSVVSIAQGAKGIFDGLKKTYEVLSKEGEDEPLEQLKKGFAALVPVYGKGIKPIRESWGKLADMAGKAAPEGPPWKKGLLVVQKEEFDEYIKEFVGKFSAAKELKRAVDDYFEMINARNQAILDYNALHLKRAQIDAHIAETDAETIRIDAIRSDQNYDPSLPACIGFMEQALDGLKTNILRRLYEEKRAAVYWSLLDSTQDEVSDHTVADLGIAHSKISGAIADVMVLKGMTQTFRLTVTLNAKELPSFLLLPETRTLTFTLPLDLEAFAGKYEVWADKYSIEIPSKFVKGNKKRLIATLVHPGTVMVRRRDKKPFHFTHQPSHVPYEIHYDGSGSFGGGSLGSEAAGYIGLSPFTTWTLDFSDLSNAWFHERLTKVKDPKKLVKELPDIKIVFEGRYAAHDGTRADTRKRQLRTKAPGNEGRLPAAKPAKKSRYAAEVVDSPITDG